LPVESAFIFLQKQLDAKHAFPEIPTRKHHELPMISSPELTILQEILTKTP
jgi:hypothetical protein